MAGWHIGVIGGSGLYEAIALEDPQEIAVNSAFGEPSGPVTMGSIGACASRFSRVTAPGTGSLRVR